jgi:type IV pilus assembly protein PilN
MIRINLLQLERVPSGPSAFAGLAANRLHVVGGAILLAGLAGIGWAYTSVSAERGATALAMQQAQAERQRLNSVLEQVAQFEVRRTQLQQRVVLIEQLRQGQSSPVTLLDQISRGLPERLWLTQLKASGSDVFMEGRTTTLTALSDLIGNLESSSAFARPVEILDSNVETANDIELVRFQVRAVFPQGETQREPATGPAPAAPGKARSQR